ncbi:hypothetical protein [Bradyrhizobium sp. HKCCYLR20261]|uniref:hypothetical protein n=1 Tax=Bradyrhizobium sp. HKCCYLR20261 TaxID=3420760 RepID=UPI003EB80D24
MKLIPHKALLLTAALAGLTSLSAQAETTSITNGSNAATVTQSGAPATDKKVETRPGYTKIEQSSGGNSATIVQKSGPATSSTTETDPGHTSATPTPDPDAADGDDDRKSSMTDSDVYREVRKGASPQSQKTLDNLMKSMGLQKKM